MDGLQPFNESNSTAKIVNDVDNDHDNDDDHDNDHQHNDDTQINNNDLNVSLIRVASLPTIPAPAPIGN